jgi:hypothetical protein
MSMDDSPLIVMCVHGVGHGEADPQLQPTWTQAINDGIHRWGPNRQVQCRFVDYDDLFAKAPLDAATVTEALAKLSVSGIVHGVGDLLGLSREFGGLPDLLRWTAGMVAQWAQEDDLRAETRQRLLEDIGQWKPDLIVAHSLGSLISYDTFGRVENQAAIQDRSFISLGSQIGNPFVRDTLGGRIVMLQADHWYHLYNVHDKAFAAPIRLADPEFEQVPTPFDINFLDHDAVQYLTHPNTLNSVWRTFAGGALSRALVKSRTMVDRALQKPARRALLIGINDYPDPANQLEGCVNDVFRVSEVLQECGFAPEDIRVVLNDRATASGILDRLEWLLDGAEDGQDRVFFYSGHGAQIPAYGTGEQVDHVDECLVPYDFDWTLEHAITDVQFQQLYSQLPYNTSFLAIFDCCHSGGMTRDGGPRVRGIAPPDDIRHRMLKWNVKEKMWEARDIKPVNPDAKKWDDQGRGFAGASGVTQRLGRAMALRSLPDKTYDATRKAFGHFGPYLPVLLEACREDQLSYEYRHGVTSFGAFTYSVTQIFRDNYERKTSMTWTQLIRATTQKLERLRYNQTPVLVGPQKVIAKAIPWKIEKKHP